MRRLVIAALVSAGVGVVAAPGAMAAAPMPFIGPSGSAWCDGSGVVSGSPDDIGTARFTYRQGTVSVTVRASGLTPGEPYSLTLIQGISDCYTEDTTVTANSRGTASVTWKEPAVSTHAFALFYGPGGTWVTETFTHAAPGA